MAWQSIRIARFGGPEVLDLAEDQAIPVPGSGEVRIKVLAAGTGFTDAFIRRGRYPDFKGPLPFTPGYDLVGVVGATGPGVTARAKASWSPISVSLAATHNMRSARRASSFRSRMRSIPLKRPAS